MHVDGFRFDLASALARELLRRGQTGRVLRHHSSGSRHFAGEADCRAVGSGRRRVSGRQFPRRCGPSGMARIATLCARFWKGDGGTVAELGNAAGRAAPISTSRAGDGPYASINFVTAHDGFTLHDLVTYNEKHNEANGEDNRDGANDNLSWNCGVEGPTDDPAIKRAARAAEAQFLRDAVAVAGRADAERRRRDQPHAAGQQQRLLPGQRNQLARWDLDRRSRRSSTSCAASSV